MLQRAASNAYSWWWAGHIRTKQSKWLEQSLQDMEEKVEYVLKLIQEDGDSFAKRAEMYYKKRPELINFVEEFYRAFRALAERYDSLSTELQNANTTIATCFPEQVQFAMDDEDDYNSTKNPKFNLPQGPNPNLPIPKVPKVPNLLKGMITDGSKKLQPRKPTKPTDTKRKVPKSGLTKGEALEEIDKLQKDILALQTTKEFVKSSYENGISKYWGLENEIMEKQERVSRLQDEFGEGTVIDDNDARTLMAEAALKSCQETLAQLQDKQERSVAEAKAENKKIEDARQRLKSLKHKFLPDQTDDETIDENLHPCKVQEDLPSTNKEEVGPEGQKLEVLCEKIKKQFETDSIGSITVTELAKKVDDLVNKVISLEGSVSSQTVLIDRLRTEADDLHSQIRSLEDEKETLLGGTHNLKRVKEMEGKLYGVQNLNKNFITQNINLQTHFTEAHSSLDQLSVKIQNVTPDEESEVTGSLPEAEGSIIEGKLQEALEKQNKGQGGDNVVNNNTSGTDKKADEIEKNISASPVNNQKGEGKEANGKSDTSQVPKQQEKVENKKEEEEKKDSSQTIERPLNVEPQKSEIEKAKEFEDELNWQQMLLSGLEDKERILLTEYTTILRNYKEVKKKLSEEEKKNDTLFETTVQVRDLKSIVSKKDQEIQSLRHKLNLLQGESGDVPEANDSAGNENFCSPPTEEEEAEIKFLINQPQTISPIEEKLRGKIDAILDENLEFWLRFSAVFHQVQKFKTEVQDLQAEILQLKKKEVKKQEGKSSTSLSADLKADVRAVYKHLTEKKTELTVWLEQSESLKDELQRRFSSICTIQEDITAALKEGVEEEEITFSSHQAAKFHGEVLNMKQENNMVNEELLAGIDHITTLRIESEKTLAKLDADYGLSESKPALRSGSRSRIPLRSFIFGIKAKKQKQSILSYMQHSKKTPS